MTILQIAALLVDIVVFGTLFFYIYLMFKRNNDKPHLFENVFLSDVCKVIVIAFVCKILINLLSITFVKFEWFKLVLVFVDMLVIYLWWGLYKTNYTREYEQYERYQKEEAFKALTATKADDDDEKLI